MQAKRKLIEANRRELIRKSAHGASYAGQANKNRWAARVNAHIAQTVADYNQIDMDTFWKHDKLSFQIKVQGESASYQVTVELAHVCQELRKLIHENRNILTRELIYKALQISLNSGDIKIDCSCPDFKYRFKAWATEHGYNAGQRETRHAAETNPHDNLGAGCKHVLCVLNNAEWLQKIASVINNYINYCKDNMEYNYAKYIFPKLYDMSYEDAVSDVSDETLRSDEYIINLANALGKVRGRIQKGHNKNPVSQANRS